MGLSVKAATEQLTNSTKGAEALVMKLRDLHLRIEMLRNTRQVSSETASLLDSLVNSAFVNASNLKTSLQPFSSSVSPAPEGQEGEEKPRAEAEGLSCHRCGREIKEEYKLCPFCGYDLRPKTCDGCGQEVKADFRFCPACGKRFE